MLRLDHLVVSCETLAQGVQDLEAKLGVPLAGGGVHDAMGTHNRLLSLGPDEYLELIAINPDGRAPDQPRWFDLDHFSGTTRLTNWVCATDDLDASIAQAPPGIGIPTPLARADLRWQFAVPQDGKLPFDNRFPALISWEGSAHPAARLPDQGLRLQALRLWHPDAAGLREALAPLYSDARLQILEGAPRIEAELSTPKGTLLL